MPIGFGIASSHAPGMYNTEDWGYERVNSPARRMPGPQPVSLMDKITKDDIKSDYKRFRAGHKALKDLLAKYNPDALIYIGGDQSEVMDKSNKANLMMYTGAQAYGYNSATGQKLQEEFRVNLKCDVDLSKHLLKELIKTGFDVAQSSEIKPLGRMPEKGISHAFSNPINEILPRPDLPVVLFWENTYDPPALLPASRCYELGKALAKILEKDPRRIAIYGSGGLSHDPGGPRWGWVDEPLDRWVLEQITTGNGQNLKDMWEFDSMTLSGGTGEIRAWVTVTGAMEHMGAKATVVDYFPALETVTGIGFAAWQTAGAK